MLERVAFFEPATWRVLRGWVNPDAVAVVRPVKVNVGDGLCPACAEGLAAPAAVHVRLLDGSEFVVLGDGCSPDGEAVRLARKLLVARGKCEREQHLGFDRVLDRGSTLR